MTKKSIGITIVALLGIVAIVVVLPKIKSPVSEGSGTSSFKTLPVLSMNIYEIEDGWGYEILLDDKTFIYQESIPGINGQKKFQSKPDAEKCASLVLEKIKNQEMPSISKQELDSLQIHY